MFERSTRHHEWHQFLNAAMRQRLLLRERESLEAAQLALEQSRRQAEAERERRRHEELVDPLSTC